jgi:hypothetical protein
MPDISLVVPPTTTIVSTLDNVKSMLGITTAAQDTLLTQLLYSASEDCQNYVGRPIWRAKFQESMPGSNLRGLVMSRYPIASVDSVVSTGGTIGVSDIAFKSRLAGILDYSAGWLKDGDPNRYTIQYTAGYFMPGDDIVASISVANSDNSFNSATSAFHELLRPGDVIYGSGFSNASNNGRHVISTATTAKRVITSDSTLVDENAASRTLGIRTSPQVFEDATFELIEQMLRRSQTDPNKAPDWQARRSSSLARLSPFKEISP